MLQSIYGRVIGAFDMPALWGSRMATLCVAATAPRSYRHSQDQNEVRLLHIPLPSYGSSRINIWHNRHQVILLDLNLVIYFCHMWKVPHVINVKNPSIAPVFFNSSICSKAEA